MNPSRTESKNKLTKDIQYVLCVTIKSEKGSGENMINRDVLNLPDQRTH